MAIQVRSGVTKVTISGAYYDLASDVTYNVNSLKRETLVGMDGVHGWAEPPVQSMISFTLRDSNSLGLAAFQNMVNVPVAIYLRNGKTILGVGMWSVDTQDVDVREALVKVKFEGANTLEIS